MAQERYFDNTALPYDTSYDGKAYGSSHIALNENGDTGQSIPFNIFDGGMHGYFDVATRTHIKASSVGTSISHTTSVSNFFALDVAITDNDIDLLNAEPELIAKLMADDLTTGLSFLKENVKYWYPCNDFRNGEYIADNMQIFDDATTSRPIYNDGGVPMTPITDGYNIASTTASDNNYRPAWQCNGSFNGTYAVEIKTKVNSGTYKLSYIYTGDVNLYVNITSSEDFIYRHIATKNTSYYRPATAGQSEPIYNVDQTMTVTPFSGVEIIGYTDNCRNIYKNTNYGLSSLLLKLNEYGTFEGMADANTAEYKNSNGAEIHTRFKPNLQEMTLTNVVSGNLEDLDVNGVGLGTFSQREEYRRLKTDGTYLINNVLQLTSPPELVSQFVLNSSGRLLSYSYINGDTQATLEDDTATADGYLIIDMVTAIGKEYVVSVLPDVVSTPLQSYYKNRVVIDTVQIPLSNQGTTLKQELTFIATEAITPLYLYAADVTITYSEISLKEKAVNISPPLPDPSTYIVLGDVAVIGNPDTVDRTECQFMVHTDVTTTEEDLADYDEYMACVLNGEVGMVDDSGAYLQDDNANFLVEG